MSAALAKLANASSSSLGRALHLKLPKGIATDSALVNRHVASGAARAAAAVPEETSSQKLQQAAGWLSLNAPHLKDTFDTRCLTTADASKQLVAGRSQYLSKLAREDPTYCQWILRQAKGGDVSPKIQAMADWLKDNAPHVQECGILASGSKHYGRPVSELVTEDPVFCQWALQKVEEGDASLGVREIAEWLKKNAPHLQERGPFASGRKHRGRPMSEVVAEDPAYCLWVLQEAKAATASHGLREMAKWLTANAPHLKDSLQVQDKGCFVSGGKYHGRPMSDLVTEDAAYCKWILRRAKDPASSQTLRDKAMWLKEHAPHLEEQVAAKAEVPITGGRQGNDEFLSRLVAEKPSYCLWILRAAEEKEACDKLRDQAAWLSKHAPHLKETRVVCMRSVHRGIPLPQLVAEDPRWCRFVLDQAEAKCKEFGEVAVWLRENAPELRDVSSDDEAIFEELSRKMLERYGQWFVIRYGKHRMKTFSAVVQEAPGFVRWAQETVARNAREGAVGRNSSNFELFVTFAQQLRSQEKEDPVVLCDMQETDVQVACASGQPLPETIAQKATESMTA
ncbi:unnamed protein product [Symbiodinium sp. CCMP2456]|nr:unnamed protein product [Symbiodinium sp. CCMP2456]